jgi:hypothetical protein
MKNKKHCLTNQEIEKIQDKIARLLHPDIKMEKDEKWHLFVDTCGFGEFIYKNGNTEFMIRNKRKFANARLSYEF